jgi:hypothetical protein
MKFREILESTITDWMKIIRAEHGKDVKFEKAEMDCTVAMKGDKCVGTYDRKAGKQVTEGKQRQTDKKALLQKFMRWSDGMHPSEMSVGDVDDFIEEYGCSASDEDYLLSLQNGRIKEDAELAKKIVRGQKYGPGLGNKLNQWFSDLMISRDKRRFLPSKVAVEQLKRTGFSDEQVSLIRDAAVKAAYEVIERLKRQYPDRVPAKYVSQLPSSFAVFDLFLNVDEEMHEKYVQQLAKLFDLKVAKLAGQLKLKEDATTDKWRRRMYELRALQKERKLTTKELDELMHLEDLVIHDRREIDEGRKYVIKSRKHIMGKFTEPEEYKPVFNQKFKIDTSKPWLYQTKAAAEARARELSKDAYNIPYAKRKKLGYDFMNYWVEPYKAPKNVKEADETFIIMANVSGGVTGNRTAPVRQGGKLLKFSSEQEAKDHALHLTKTANRQSSVAQFKYWAAPYRDYLHQESVQEAAAPLKTNFIPDLEKALRRELKADSVIIAPWGKKKDTFSVNIIFSKARSANLDQNQVWKIARKFSGHDVHVEFNTPRFLGANQVGLAYIGKLTFRWPVKEADEVRFSSGRKVGLDKWLDDMSAEDKTKKKKPVKKYENKPWPKMKVPGVVVTAGQGLRDRLVKAVKDLGIDIEHQGYSGGSTLWTVAFYPKKGFNLEKFRDDLRDKLNFDGYLEVEFEDLSE